MHEECGEQQTITAEHGGTIFLAKDEHLELDVLFLYEAKSPRPNGERKQCTWTVST